MEIDSYHFFITVVGLGTFLLMGLVCALEAFPEQEQNDRWK